MFPKIVGFPPKSSILIGFSIINHPFWGTPIVGNTHLDLSSRELTYPTLGKGKSAQTYLGIRGDILAPMRFVF